jgi:LEA14-like dessication related protein
MSEARRAGRDATQIAPRLLGHRSSALLLAALFLLGACAGLRTPLVAPKVSVEGIVIGEVRGGEASVTLLMRVENPNAIDLTLQSLRFAFSLNEIALTNGGTIKAGTIEAGGSKVIDVDTRTDMNAVLRLVALSATRRTLSLRYALEGEAIVQNGVHLPFSHRGDIPLPRAPSQPNR